jgi:hypothetical protein
MTSTTKVTFRIADDLLGSLNVRAKAAGMTRNAYVNALLSDTPQTEPSAPKSNIEQFQEIVEPEIKRITTSPRRMVRSKTPIAHDLVVTGSHSSLYANLQSPTHVDRSIPARTFYYHAILDVVYQAVGRSASGRVKYGIVDMEVEKVIRIRADGTFMNLVDGVISINTRRGDIFYAGILLEDVDLIAFEGYTEDQKLQRANKEKANQT